MSSISVFLKDNLGKIPYRLGVFLARMPYSYRPGIGSTYNRRVQDIAQYESLSLEGKQSFIFSRMKNIVRFAFENVSFYQDHYESCDFHPSQLKGFDDLKEIPIVSKSLLQGYDLEFRSALKENRYIVNTGGSTGQPLSFYILPDSMGHEWAHMHTVWRKFGYKTSDLKLTFVGRGDFKSPVEYDAVRHQLNVSIYEEFERTAWELKKSRCLSKVTFLHGYPSAIYEFALYCEKYDKELRDSLVRTLKGVFFGSEYPTEQWRDKIESVFSVDSVSWYGHTERAVLAYEKYAKYKYVPFQTYGYTEVDEKHELVGTSYYNFASPLIRYNTEDQISEVEMDGGIMSQFVVSGGRKGEYIVDSENKRIPLTGFIYGRHHKLFDLCKYVQVRQRQMGKAEILCVANDKGLATMDLSKLFDKGDVKIQLSFTLIEQPVKTISGKVKLLID